MILALRRSILAGLMASVAYFGFLAGILVPQNVMAADHRVGDNHEHAILHDYVVPMTLLGLVALIFIGAGVLEWLSVRKMDKTGVCKTCRQLELKPSKFDGKCVGFDSTRRSLLRWKWLCLVVGTHVLFACIGCIWWIHGWSATVA